MATLTQQTEYINFEKQDTVYSFLPTGDIYEFLHKYYMINQFQGSVSQGSANNIYLRVYEGEKVIAYPLLGIKSNSTVKVGNDTLSYHGEAAGVSYIVTFYPHSDEVWLWDVSLDGNGKTVDLLYAQDIGVAAKGGVLVNELYMAQYLGHTICDTENGFTICSRQNQQQGDGFPYLSQGMIRGKAVGYCTDGTQFFGLSYKATGKPELLEKPLPSVNYQYEFSYTVLQTEQITLQGEHAFTFYGIFKENHPTAITKPEFIGEAMTALEQYKGICSCNASTCPQITLRPEFTNTFTETYTSQKWDNNRIDKTFPDRKLEEYGDNKEVLSFFTDSHTHVVLQQKELLCERPHGHVITTALDTNKVNSNLITSTNYIYGLFNGQTVAGNTSMHKFISTPRGVLNVLKHYGQRILVKLSDGYKLLGLPSAYEMGMNFSRWYYDVTDNTGCDSIIVTSFAVFDKTDIVLDVRSTSGKVYEFIVTTQLAMGDNEFTNDIEMEVADPHTLVFKPDKKVWAGNPYPNLSYAISIPNKEFSYSDDSVFFSDGKTYNGSLLTLTLSPTDSFQLVIRGNLEGDSIDTSFTTYSFEDEVSRYTKLYSKLTNGFNLKLDGGDNNLEKLNEIALWYTHNAMVHFAVPHGLEQPGGAAWGTRDVCQGPMEFFLMTQSYSLARDVLIKIFAHQIIDTHEWPQWFMFDRYTMHAHECHGDVVLWPLKIVADYIEQSGDKAVLNEVIPYITASGSQSEVKQTLLEHIKLACSTIRSRFLEGTSLISYAGGDWDDTLQPADEELKVKLVSAWTQGLAYQVVDRLGRMLSDIDAAYSKELSQMADSMKQSFMDILLIDGVIAGFVYRDDDGSFKPMLHPNDTMTGINYRLLPMTRSVIAQMVSPEQAKVNIQVVDQKLKCPDGVRLMNLPTRYSGGVSKLFCRAEQAANVGREIGLQYVHAHIRYIEAVAKLGYSDRVWEALFQINPINIKEAVPNAVTRQSNLYFSSSDGLFTDRYDYYDNFNKLYDGSVAVKGGWRLYSSGPGIYLNQVVSNILGIRFNASNLVVDPVLPKTLDGLTFSYSCFGKNVTFKYKLSGNNDGVSLYIADQKLEGTTVPNPYRQGGIMIDSALLQDGCTIEVLV